MPNQNEQDRNQPGQGHAGQAPATNPEARGPHVATTAARAAIADIPGSARTGLAKGRENFAPFFVPDFLADTGNFYPMAAPATKRTRAASPMPMGGLRYS